MLLACVDCRSCLAYVATRYYVLVCHLPPPLLLCLCRFPPNRSAEQSTEMFRSLRSVAMQLDQGLAEMEDLDCLLEEDEDPACNAPVTSGPANVEANTQVCKCARTRCSCAGGPKMTCSEAIATLPWQHCAMRLGDAALAVLLHAGGCAASALLRGLRSSLAGWPTWGDKSDSRIL